MDAGAIGGYRACIELRGTLQLLLPLAKAELAAKRDLQGAARGLKLLVYEALSYLCIRP